jgi:hypothetical protein
MNHSHPTPPRGPGHCLNKAWTHAATQMQCSPAGLLIALMLLAAVVLGAGHVSQVITALKVTAACLLCATGLGILGAVTWSTSRGWRSQTTPAPADGDASELGALADQLADTRTLIQLTPDNAALEVTSPAPAQKTLAPAGGRK